VKQPGDPGASPAGDGRVALRVAEVARRIGVNEETVRRALVRGELPGRKLGSTWLVQWPHSRRGYHQLMRRRRM